MKKIENQSREILLKYNLLQVPIDVEAVASSLEIEIIKQDLDDDVSGFLVRKGDKNIIGLNQNHPEVRKRFTISHEIGHYMLHVGQPLFVDFYKGSKLYRKDRNSRNYKIEMEANSFAASLLMPKELVIEELSKQSEDLDYNLRLKNLSSIFKVSCQAMEYRLNTIGFYDYGF